MDKILKVSEARGKLIPFCSEVVVTFVEMYHKVYHESFTVTVDKKPTLKASILKEWSQEAIKFTSFTWPTQANKKVVDMLRYDLDELVGLLNPLAHKVGGMILKLQDKKGFEEFDFEVAAGEL